MTRRPIGKVYAIAPQPPDAARTTYFDAGALKIGVEYRHVDPESLTADYTHDPAQLEALLAASAPGGFTDNGVSIHVVGSDDGHEYLRFDVFDDEPHYHYIHRGDEIVNNVVDYDVAAFGDMFTWAIACLHDRVATMIAVAGGGDLVSVLDQERWRSCVDTAAGLAARLRRAPSDEVWVPDVGEPEQQPT